MTSRVSRRGSCPSATLRNPPPAACFSSDLAHHYYRRNPRGGLPWRPGSALSRTGLSHREDGSGGRGLRGGCTRLHRKPRPRPAGARRPPPGRAALCPAGAGYQRHLSAQGQPLRTHSRPDTTRLYTETGFARLTPAAPGNAHRTHTALIREAAAPPPRHHSRFVPAEGASWSQPRNVSRT